MKRSKTLVLNYILSNVGILLPIYACDLIYAIMLTLTTKKVNDGFVPVGEEDFAAVIQTRDGYVAILADGDGKTKAQTKALEKKRGRGDLQ